MRATPHSWVGRLNIVKISAVFKLICRLNKISVEIRASYFVEIDKLMLKFLRKYKIFRTIKTLLKENKDRKLTLRDQKIYKSDQDSVVLA